MGKDKVETGSPEEIARGPVLQKQNQAPEKERGPAPVPQGGNSELP